MIFALTGKSSSGKDSLSKRIEKYKLSISSTSRPIRENEKDGIDYHFLTKEQFEERIEQNKFIEYRSYSTKKDGIDEKWYYGTEFSQISDGTILVIELEGLEKIRSVFKNVLAIYLECPEDIRKERAKSRGSFCEIEWERRVKTDDIDFSNERISRLINFIVDSSKDFDEVLEEIKNIIETKEQQDIKYKNELKRMIYKRTKEITEIENEIKNMNNEINS